jgi:hypothetical protein
VALLVWMPGVVWMSRLAGRGLLARVALLPGRGLLAEGGLLARWRPLPGAIPGRGRRRRPGLGLLPGLAGAG